MEGTPKIQLKWMISPILGNPHMDIYVVYFAQIARKACISCNFGHASCHVFKQAATTIDVAGSIA